MARYKRQRIQEGRHSVNFIDRYFRPYRNRDFKLSGFMYGEGLKYDYGSPDNLDWNKYAGIQLDLYRPHGRTIMVVFRYLKNLDSMEWGLYYHNITNGLGEYRKVGSVPGLIDENQTIITPVGSTPLWEVRFLNRSQVELKLIYDKQVVNDLVTFQAFGRKHTRGNFYWGGNMPSPGDVESQKKYEKI